jgi:iron complex outermembrane receptor protein
MKMGDPFNWVSDDEDPGFAGNIRTPHITDEIKSLRVGGKYSFESGMFSKLDFGANYSKRDKKIQKNEVRLNLPTDATGALHARHAELRRLTGITPMTLAGIPGVHGAWTCRRWCAVGRWSSRPCTGTRPATTPVCMRRSPRCTPSSAMDTEVAGLPLTGNLGLQAVHTKQNAEGWVWLGNNLKAPDLKDLYAVTWRHQLLGRTCRA